MANELKLTFGFTYAKDDVAYTENLTDSVTVTATGFLHHVQNIGTTDEAINIGDLSAGGYMMLRNLDSTNFIGIRQANDLVNLIRLLAGEVALFRLDNSSTAPFAIADTAACDMEVWLLDL